MHRIETIHKKVGETPLHAIEAYRERMGIDRGIPLAYAGRLDPMAEGKLIVLIGEACKDQLNYHALDKEYVVKILLGLKSDSGDILGLASKGVPVHPPKAAVANALTQLVGDITLPYPAFSSKPVAGKPLFLHTLEGTLKNIKIPHKRSRIYRLSLLDCATLSSDALKEHILAKIDLLPLVTEPSKAYGRDFRRAEIQDRWHEVLVPEDTYAYPVLTIRCVCSSGTYMRSLAEALGDALGTTGMALSIKRTNIGTYRAIGPFGIWTKRH